MKYCIFLVVTTLLFQQFIHCCNETEFALATKCLKQCPSLFSGVVQNNRSECISDLSVTLQSADNGTVSFFSLFNLKAETRNSNEIPYTVVIQFAEYEDSFKQFYDYRIQSNVYMEQFKSKYYFCENNTYYLKSDIENHPEIIAKVIGKWKMSELYLVDTGILTQSDKIDLKFNIPTFNSTLDVFWIRVILILEPSIVWEYQFNLSKPALLSYSDFQFKMKNLDITNPSRRLTQLLVLLNYDLKHANLKLREVEQIYQQYIQNPQFDISYPYRNLKYELPKEYIENFYSKYRSTINLEQFNNFLLSKTNEVIDAIPKLTSPAFANGELKQSLGFFSLIADNINFNLVGGDSDFSDKFEPVVVQTLCKLEKYLQGGKQFSINGQFFNYITFNPQNGSSVKMQGPGYNNSQIITPFYTNTSGYFLDIVSKQHSFILTTMSFKKFKQNPSFLTLGLYLCLKDVGIVRKSFSSYNEKLSLILQFSQEQPQIDLKGYTFDEFKPIILSSVTQTKTSTIGFGSDIGYYIYTVNQNNLINSTADEFIKQQRQTNSDNEILTEFLNGKELRKQEDKDQKLGYLMISHIFLLYSIFVLILS